MERNFSTELRNVFWISLIAFLQGIQALALLAFVVGRIPAKSFLADIVYPEWLYRVQPEHEIFLFRSFVLMTIIFQATAFFIFRNKISDVSLKEKLRPFALTETLFVALMTAAAFQMVVYAQRPQLAQQCLSVLAVFAILNKIFWVRVSAFFDCIRKLIIDPVNWPAVRELTVAAFVVFIILLINIPDPDACLARMFMGEQFHHYDSFIMAPGWAHISGVRLNMDVISQYGVGMPIVLSELSKLFGEFSYLSVFKMFVWGTILYFIASFFFLGMWLRSFLIAAIGILMGIKVYMFHTGISPFLFTLPSTTIFRNCFDIIVFFLLFYHLLTHRRYVLVVAAAVCGFAIFYMTSTGMCLAISFYAYLLAHMVTGHIRHFIFRNMKDAAYLLTLAAIVPVVLIGCMWIANGNSLWSKEFSYNMKEFNLYFLNGFGTMPIYESLQNRNYLASLMGFFIPLVYILTLTVIASLIYRRKIAYPNLLVVIISLYGLTMYHYYIARSAETSYYVVAVPYVFVCCYWLKVLGERLSPRLRFRIYFGILMFVLYALLTTHNYVGYPNALNISRDPITDPRIVHPLSKDGSSYFNHLYNKANRLPKEWFQGRSEDLKVESDFGSDDELAQFYKQRFDLGLDAALISQLTKPQEKVALISSFEVRILMQAKRKPFFYYFPLIISRPMSMHMFATSSLYTLDHYHKTIKQLDETKPLYIFIEKTFYLARLIPKDYKPVDAFVPLMFYVLSHYSPYAESGGYLVALKRNDAPALIKTSDQGS